MRLRVVVAVTARTALDVVVGHIDHLHHHGWDVHVVVGQEVSERLFPHAQLHVVPMNRGISPASDIVAFRRWSALLQRLRPDVVVAATPKAAFLGMTAARAVGVEHRVWWAWGLRSETSDRAAVRWAERATARAATDIVAASPSLASSVASLTGARAHVVADGAIAGVDLDVFTPSPQLPDEPTAVYVGRIAADKGMDDLATIWAKVVERVPAARLLVAGLPDELDPPGPAWEAMRHRPEVSLLGWVDDIADLIAGSRVLLLPSAREGMPAVVLEAAACAVPAVTWDVTGSRDAVANGLTGYVCASGHYDEFTAKTIELLTDDDRCTVLGQAARAHVGRHFDRHDVETRFEQYLRQVVARRAPESAAEGEPVLDLTVGVPAVQPPSTTVRR